MKRNKTVSKVKPFGVFVFGIYKKSGNTARSIDCRYNPSYSLSNQQITVSFSLLALVNRKSSQFCSRQA